MLSVQAALDLVHQHLGDAPRAHHSIVVGFAMRRLATYVAADPTPWEIVGLCHDIDFDHTRDDPSQHGLLAAQWLNGQLPEAALLAIKSHDHRSGVTCATPIAHALKLADALAVVHENLGNSTAPSLAAPNAAALLAETFVHRPYLPAMIAHGAAALGISFSELAEICAAAPPQARTT